MVRIITDSTCDIPFSQAEGMGVQIIPLQIHFGEECYRDQLDISNQEFYEKLAQYVAQKGVKTGFVMWPIRTALSGKQMTPAGATEIMEILGKEESLARLKKGIQLLSEGEC